MSSVRVLFFAALRESVQAKELCVEIEDGVKASELVDCLGDVYPKAVDLLRQVRIAVNQRITGEQETLKDGDEVALLLPVSGG